jgi:hypothetical protein
MEANETVNASDDERKAENADALPADTNEKSESGEKKSEDTQGQKKRKISPPKFPRGSKPPALSLDEAAIIITRFYEDTGGEASYDALSAITQNSSGSSVFLFKLSALKNYGLISDENRILILPPLGLAVAAPHTPAERAEALKEAFLKLEVFKNAYERYKGRLLPQDEYLVNAFTTWVPREVAPEWVEKFKASATEAGLLEDRNGKLQVREAPRADTPEPEKAEAIPETPAAEPQPRQEEAAPSPAFSKDVIRTPIPLGPGRLAHIELPKDWKASELKKLLRLLALSLGDVEDEEKLGLK